MFVWHVRQMYMSGRYQLQALGHLQQLPLAAGQCKQSSESGMFCSDMHADVCVSHVPIEGAVAGLELQQHHRHS